MMIFKAPSNTTREPLGRGARVHSLGPVRGAYEIRYL